MASFARGFAQGLPLGLEAARFGAAARLQREGQDREQREQGLAILLKTQEIAAKGDTKGAKLIATQFGFPKLGLDPNDSFAKAFIGSLGGQAANTNAIADILRGADPNRPMVEQIAEIRKGDASPLLNMLGSTPPQGSVAIQTRAQPSTGGAPTALPAPGGVPALSGATQAPVAPQVTPQGAPAAPAAPAALQGLQGLQSKRDRFQAQVGRLQQFALESNPATRALIDEAVGSLNTQIAQEDRKINQALAIGREAREGRGESRSERSLKLKETAPGLLGEFGGSTLIGKALSTTAALEGRSDLDERQRRQLQAARSIIERESKGKKVFDPATGEVLDVPGIEPPAFVGQTDLTGKPKLQPIKPSRVKLRPSKSELEREKVRPKIDTTLNLIQSVFNSASSGTVGPGGFVVRGVETVGDILGQTEESGMPATKFALDMEALQAFAGKELIAGREFSQGDREQIGRLFRGLELATGPVGVQLAMRNIANFLVPKGHDTVTMKGIVYAVEETLPGGKKKVVDPITGQKFLWEP